MICVAVAWLHFFLTAFEVFSNEQYIDTVVWCLVVLIKVLGASDNWHQCCC